MFLLKAVRGLQAKPAVNNAAHFFFVQPDDAKLDYFKTQR